MIDDEMDAVLAGTREEISIDAEMDKILLGSTGSEKEIMANIPPLSPQQEFAVPDVKSPEFKRVSTLTPKEKETARESIGSIIPGIARRKEGQSLTPKWLPNPPPEFEGSEIEKVKQTIQWYEEHPEASADPGYIGQELSKALSLIVGGAGAGKLPKGPGRVQITPPTGVKPYEPPLGPQPELVPKFSGKAGKAIKTVGGKEEPLEVGEAVIKSSGQKRDILRQEADSLYNHATAIAPKESIVSLDKTYKIAKDVLDDPYSLLEAKSVASKVTKMVTKGQPATFEQAENLRRLLSKLTTGKNKAEAVELLQSLEDEIQYAAKKTGQEAVKKAYDTARGHYRDKFIPQRDLAEILESKSPEKIIDYVTTNVRQSRELLNSLSKKDVESIRRGIVRRLWNKTEDEAKFLDEVGKFTRNKKEVFETVFTKDQQKVLKNLSNPGWFKKNPWAGTVAKRLMEGIALGAAGYQGWKIFQ